jgi:hypothetical protein
MLARGTFGTGSRAGWVVTSSDTTPSKPKATLTINWEAGGAEATAPLPCDDFDLKDVELFPKVERNIFYAGITTATLALAYQAAQASTPAGRADASTRLAALSDPQKTLGQNLRDKLLEGKEGFYLAGVRYEWTSYSYSLPSFDLGGYIQAPLGPLESYFTGIDFLRLCDRLKPVGVNGSCYQIISTWLGGPAGHWDTDLYDS